MRALKWVGGAAIAALGAYWLVIVGEGAYLGRWAVRAVYSWGAPIYDRVHGPARAADCVLATIIRRALLGQSRMPSLDVGTGTGRVPLLLGRENWYTGAIHGLDLTPAMLAQARANAATQGFGERFVWHRGSGDDLTHWADSTFGLVTCLEALEYMPQPRRGVEEMWRVLAPGGTLVVSAWLPRHARLMPGKAFTAPALVGMLRARGCGHAYWLPWQPGAYHLVVAAKPRSCAF